MKSWYQSKTVWFNVLFGLVSLAGLFGYAEFKPDGGVVEGLAILGSAINLVLRLFFTKEKIG